jgi:signal transduction histidine kinase
VALEATASLVSLLTGFLVFGRLQRNSQLGDVLLVIALAIITVSNVLFILVPLVTEPVIPYWVRWAALGGRVAGCLLFAVAAFVPRVRLRRPRQAHTLAAAGALAVLLLIEVVTRLFQSSLPSPHSDLTWFALQLLAALLAAAAAVGYFRRSAQLHDEFPAWLAIAASFGAASSLSYAINLASDPTRDSIGDVFRLCFFIVLLVGSMREIRSYWHQLVLATVAEERQRIARDLHDGLSQELAYLTRNLSDLRGTADETTVRQLGFSVDRARFAVRAAVHRVASAPARPVADELSEAATQVARRFGLDLELDLAPGIGVAPARASALVGIACEALTNAAQHSGSRQVSVVLRRDGGRVRMRVRDWGQGFDVTASRGGFGLTSMRDRARSVGGDVSISSEPGGGSQVEASV